MQTENQGEHRIENEHDDFEYRAADQFVTWLERRVMQAGRGDRVSVLDVEPDGKFWFGRVAPEARVMASGLGERGERLEPCAFGIRCKPSHQADTDLYRFEVWVRCCVWTKRDGRWMKSPIVEVHVTVETRAEERGLQTFGRDDLRDALATASGRTGFAAELRVEPDTFEGDRAITLVLVNTSDDRIKEADSNLYQCELEIESNEPTEPFHLSALPDSFRYDRRVPAYGVNCGVLTGTRTIRTVDAPTSIRKRPTYWSNVTPEPDFSFHTLARDPIPPLSQLIHSLNAWGEVNWSSQALKDRAKLEKWSELMLEEAHESASQFRAELLRMEEGLNFLRGHDMLRAAFCAMNRAIGVAARGKYDQWRPFQIGFQLTTLRSIVDLRSEADVVDVVWFATGGGKTETYLGHILTAAFMDRMTGKTSGITAWSRFPLRMLSLQQTQRFANALAAGEIVRRELNLGGDPFSLGFFVGQGATPNSIKPEPGEGDFDPDDDDAPRRYQVLAQCPFCREDTIEMGFNRKLWRLEHRCTNQACCWPDRVLPFYIVDDEIYRYLPTVVVGTLDKAASISMQGAMRGFVGGPLGRCSVPDHGYVYAPRSKRPNGCLVPDCPGSVVQLGMEEKRFPPSFRLQDELHLLRDSLGAVDAHYEALYDSLQSTLTGTKPKILASSATLTGYQKQVDVLYSRSARVFPQPGPAEGTGFWTSDSTQVMRRYVAVAPRGLTVEYAVDRMLTELQTAIRELERDPVAVCKDAGVDPKYASFIVSTYGTHVVYGNNLRDLDAVQRSLTTQVPVEGDLNVASLTGRDQFEDVRITLHRLEHPEAVFGERLHVVTASSMMSHGVDIDRLNVMVMLGLPLATAEFIQATARVGRRWPGIVFVVHKIGRERDAGIFRSFEKFIEHGDRFVEAIPITKRSRRVLDCTIAGMELARVLMVHEPRAGQPLTTAGRFRDFVRSGGIDFDVEAGEIAGALQLTSTLDEPMRRAVKQWFEDMKLNVENPPPNVKWPSDFSPTGSPMISLRDVEEQVPVSGTRI